MYNKILLSLLLLPLYSTAQDHIIGITGGITTNGGPLIYRSRTSRPVNLYMHPLSIPQFSADWNIGIQYLYNLRKWQFGAEIGTGEITKIGSDHLVDTITNEFVFANYTINIAKPYISTLGVVNWKVNLKSAYLYWGLAAGALYRTTSTGDSVVHYYANNRKYYDMNYPSGLGFTWRFQMGTEMKVSKRIGVSTEWCIGALYLGKDKYQSSYRTSLNRLNLAIRYYL